MSLPVPPSVLLGAISAAIFLDMVLYGAIVPLVPPLAKQVGASTTSIGLLFAMYSLALLLLGVPAGKASDHLGRKPLVVGGLLGLAFTSLLFWWAHDLPTLFASRILQGVAAACTWTAGLALLADLYPPELRGKRFSVVLAAMGLGSLAGPPLGGWLTHYGGSSLLFGGCAAAALLLAIVIAVPRFPAVGGPAPSEAGPPHDTSRWPWLAAAAVLLGSSGMGVLEPLLPLHLESTFKLGSAWIGTLFGCMGLAYLLAQPVIGYLGDRVPREHILVAGAAMVAALLPALCYVVEIWQVAMLLALLGVACGLLLGPTLAMFADAADESEIEGGAAFGWFNTLYSAGLLFGPAAGGYLVEIFGIGPVCIGLAGASGCLAAAGIRHEMKAGASAPGNPL